MVAAGLVDVTFETQKFWDAQADTFDDEADHGLRDAAVRGAWSRLLLFLLPDVPASVADLGYGTGSLSVLLAQAGYDVAGLDLSTRRLPVTAQVGGQDVPVVAPVPDQVRPGRPRFGQPVHEHRGPRVQTAVLVDRQRHHDRPAYASGRSGHGGQGVSRS